MTKAAGIMIATGEGLVLFLLRGPGGDFPGYWCFPGGRLEDGETAAEGAAREALEESGFSVDPAKLAPLARCIKDHLAPVAGPPLGDGTTTPTEGPSGPSVGAVDFTTFFARVPECFVPVLGPDGAPEHVAFAWCPAEAPPLPLHPGCAVALSRLTMDELGVARAIAAGDLTSPQRYGNVALFDIRITGTGASYRTKMNEFVWRDPSIYLNDDFLARCNGLPVIVKHPAKNVLDAGEFRRRVAGTVFLPYIKGDEVWAIAKIFDDEVAGVMEREVMSTSPAVVFRPGDEGDKMTMENGSVLFVENTPLLLDHIAICADGVWDKGTGPGGVASVDAVRVDSEPERPKYIGKLDAALGLVRISNINHALRGIARQ
jgi:8-oxo-dGTP pyrophosphatase MutT (NUDIX family)